MIWNYASIRINLYESMFCAAEMSPEHIKKLFCYFVEHNPRIWVYVIFHHHDMVLIEQSKNIIQQLNDILEELNIPRLLTPVKEMDYN